jgi:hypothetical protein
MPSPPPPAPPPPEAKVARKIDYLVTAWIRPALAPLGFRRSRRTFHRSLVRDGREAVQVIHVQAGWVAGRAGELYVSLAVQLPLLLPIVSEIPQYAWWLHHLGKVDEASCALRARLRHALPAEPADWWLPEMRERHDVPFLVRPDEDLPRLGALLARAVGQYGVPWLNDHGSLEAAWGPFDADPLRHGGECARLAAGILLGRRAEAAALFAEKADRLATSPERFAEVKAWALRHGLAVEAVAYRERVRAEPPGLLARRAAIEDRRARLYDELQAFLADPRPVAERVPETLDAFLAESRLAMEEPRLEATEMGRRVLLAPLDTRRALVLAALEALASAPVQVDDIHPAIWGAHYVHDGYWGILVKALLRRVPCTEAFARDLLVALDALAGRFAEVRGRCVYRYPFAAIAAYLQRQAAPWRDALRPEIWRLLDRIAAVMVRRLDDLREAARAAPPDPRTEALFPAPPIDWEAVRQRTAEVPEEVFVAEDRRAITALRRWARWEPTGGAAVEIERDDWGRQLTGAIEAAPAPMRAALTGLVAWLARGVTPGPPARWRRELAARLDALDRAALVAWLAGLLPRFAETDLAFEPYAGRGRPGAGTFPGELSGAVLLGLVHAAGALDDQALVPAVAAVLEAAWTPVPGIGVRAQSVGSACLPILARSPAGRARLRGLQPRLRQRALRQRIEAALAGPDARPGGG